MNPGSCNSFHVRFATLDQLICFGFFLSSAIMGDRLVLRKRSFLVLAFVNSVTYLIC
jgi:hypothetical protein